MAKKQSPSTLLWFIRRKAYVPLCEIRRRFELEDEAVEGGFISDTEGNRLFLGLPQTACTAIEKLWGQGKIGLDLSVEFDCRVVIGVFPMVPSRDLQESNGKSPRRSTRGASVSIVPPVDMEMPDCDSDVDEEVLIAASIQTFEIMELSEADYRDADAPSHAGSDHQRPAAIHPQEIQDYEDGLADDGPSTMAAAQ